MNGIEDELRQLFADPRRTPPGWPDATERVHAGMRRRRHRRAAIGTAVVALVVSVVAGLSFAVLRDIRQQPVHPAPPVIPWVDLPPSVQPTVMLSPRAATAVDRIDEGAAAGTQYHRILVRNAGLDRCTLAGRPVLLGSASPGGQRVITTRPAGEPVDVPNATPAAIDPGESAVVTVMTYGGCLDGRKETNVQGVRLRLPDGGEIALRTSLNTTCGVGLGPWQRPAPAPPAVSPFAALVASLDVPAVIRAGETLDFVVTLANPTGEDIRLSPCPNYIYSLTAPVKAGGSHRLNCTVSVVPARGRLRFAMRLGIPESPGYSGATTLQWTLEDGSASDVTPRASAVIRMEP
jgi:hypothetical protein